LRKIYGPRSENGYWEIKTNKIIYRGKGKIHPKKGHEVPKG